MATISKGKMRSPVLPKPLSSISASMEVKENKLLVDWLEGRVGRMGRLKVKGAIPLLPAESGAAKPGEALEVRTESFEVSDALRVGECGKNLGVQKRQVDLDPLITAPFPHFSRDVELTRSPVS